MPKAVKKQDADHYRFQCHSPDHQRSALIPHSTVAKTAPCSTVVSRKLANSPSLIAPIPSFHRTPPCRSRRTTLGPKRASYTNMLILINVDTFSRNSARISQTCHNPTTRRHVHVSSSLSLRWPGGLPCCFRRRRSCLSLLLLQVPRTQTSTGPHVPAAAFYIIITQNINILRLSSP